MKKRLALALILILISTLFISVIAVAAQEELDLVQVEIINKSGDSVALSLLSGGTVYYLSVGTDETKIFTVERAVYSHTTYACGGSAAGEVDITTQMRLVFTKCFGAAPNKGEPSQEKVHIDDSPDGLNWRYDYE
jgi:hypothetical protein